jgi:hypothetical protein
MTLAKLSSVHPSTFYVRRRLIEFTARDLRSPKSLSMLLKALAANSTGISDTRQDRPIVCVRLKDEWPKASERVLSFTGSSLMTLWRT